MSDTGREEPADVEREADQEPGDEAADAPDDGTDAVAAERESAETDAEAADGDDRTATDDDAGTAADDAGTAADDDTGTTADDAGTTADDDAGTTADDDMGTTADDAGEPELGMAERITERIADQDPEDVAREIADLRKRNDELELEVEDLESRLKRKQAEFQNYKKRQEKRRKQERERATEALVERLLEVRDNLKRALEQDEDADIREGVGATLRLLDDVLEGENVDPIEPEPGSDVDPQRHEVLLRVESDRPAGTVAAVQRPGYEMAGKVLRAAQVTVAEDGE